MRHIQFLPSDKLKKEISITPEIIDEQKTLFSLQQQFPSLDDLITFIRSSLFYTDLVSNFNLTKPTKRLLDVGSGLGFTSIYLAALGYQVTALDPVEAACRRTELLANHLSVPIKSIHGVAENIKEIDEKFDIILFHSSLHHCDDPLEALRGARTILRDRGMILLLCENILSCFRSKKWFYHTLEADPQRIGHYGGNEHAYRVNEYVRLLYDAGFRNITTNISQMAFNKPRFFNKTSLFTLITTSAMYSTFRILRQTHFLPLAKPFFDFFSLGPHCFTAVK